MAMVPVVYLLLRSRIWYGIELTDGNNDLALLHRRRCITGIRVWAYTGSKAALVHVQWIVY